MRFFVVEEVMLKTHALIVEAWGGGQEENPASAVHEAEIPHSMDQLK